MSDLCPNCHRDGETWLSKETEMWRINMCTHCRTLVMVPLLTEDEMKDDSLTAFAKVLSNLILAQQEE